MIISDEHRYLFVELHHTGSTAISAELCENYGGSPILHKHARYHEFLQLATIAQRGYFVFSAVRHPMDEAVSMFAKYLTNHDSAFTDESRFQEQGGWVTRPHRERFRFVQAHGDDFAAYFRRFHRRPYDNWSNLAHHRFDFVLRFENLSGDFARLVATLGLEPRRALPVLNQTQGRTRDFAGYYTPDIRAEAVAVFTPFMRKWGYTFPAEWGAVRAPMSSFVTYHARGIRQRLLSLVRQC